MDLIVTVQTRRNLQSQAVTVDSFTIEDYETFDSDEELRQEVDNRMYDLFSLNSLIDQLLCPEQDDEDEDEDEDDSDDE